jgi:hypothetical protein
LDELAVSAGKKQKWVPGSSSGSNAEKVAEKKVKK